VLVDGVVPYYDRPCDGDGQAAVSPCSANSTVTTNSTKQASFAARPNFSVRMTRRNVLFAERKRLSDYALVFGVAGIVLMVLETELNMAGVYDKVSIFTSPYYSQMQRVVTCINGNGVIGQNRRSYSTSSPVSTEMGDHSDVCRLIM